jgi:hypothetical protein
VLSRGGVVYATGSATRSHGRTELLLSLREQTRPGAYKLILTDGHTRTSEAVMLGS